MTQTGHSLAVLVFFFLFFSPEGRAEESSEDPGNETSHIEWHGSEGCQDRERLMSELHSLLGKETIANSPLRFSGSALFRDGVWNARLETIVDKRTLVRSITVGNCDSALKVVALLIALSLDPLAALSADDETLESIESAQEVETAQDIERGSEDEADSTIPQQMEDSKSEPKAEDLQKNLPVVSDDKEAEGQAELKQEASLKTKPNLGINLSAITDFGNVPRIGIGFAAGGELRFGWVYTRLALRYVPPRRTAVSGAEKAWLWTWLLTTTWGVGGIIELPPFSIIPQIGLSFQTIGSKTEGIFQTRSDRALYFAPWIGASVEWHITRPLGIFVQPAVHISIHRPRFEIAGIGSVHQVSLVTASLEFGFFFIF